MLKIALRLCLGQFQTENRKREMKMREKILGCFYLADIVMCIGAMFLDPTFGHCIIAMCFTGTVTVDLLWE